MRNLISPNDPAPLAHHSSPPFSISIDAKASLLRHQPYTKGGNNLVTFRLQACYGTCLTDVGARGGRRMG